MQTEWLGGKLALVTGAASGIGRATALACAARGADLAVCDLDVRGLDALAGELQAKGHRVLARQVDVADAAQVAAFADAVHAEHPAVDLLVNNAGVAVGGGFLDTSLEDWDWIVGINQRGVVHGCHFFVPRMVEARRGGHVVNIASMAGYLATEALAAYCTTKYAVVGLSEALREELYRHGIGVTAVCPGIIDTPITEHARLRGATAVPEAVDRFKGTFRRRGYPPEKVAERLLHAVARNRAIAPVTPEAWTLYLLKRAAPDLVRWLTLRGGTRARRDLGLD